MTLYSSAHVRLSAMSVQCSSGMPPSFEKQLLVEGALNSSGSHGTPRM
jgi:hypothetical protein